MGCTSSAPQEPQQAAPVVQSTTRRNSAPRETAGGGGGGRNEQRRRPAAAFAAAVAGWDLEFPAITLSQLQTKRNEFWDTRVQGRADVWQTLRVAVESMVESAETSDAILESAELTPFDIESADTCFVYDSKGFQYLIPIYTMYLPANLLQEPSAAAIAAAKAQQQMPLQVQIAPNSGRQAGGDGVEEVKSADVADAPGGGGKSIKFKVRFSNGLPDMLVDQKSSCTIGALKSLIASSHPELTPERVRIYYLGKMMASNQWNLGEIGMKKEMVLQCFIPAVKAA